MMQTIVICNPKYCKVYRQKLFSCLFCCFFSYMCFGICKVQFAFSWIMSG